MDGCVAMMRAAVESLLAAMAPCGQMDQRLMQWLRNAAALLLLVLLAGFLQTAAASSQHQQASATARKSSTDEPGIARFLRDDKGVSIIEFSGKYGIDLPAPAETVGKEFFRTHADVYDFLVVFSSFEYPTASAEDRKSTRLNSSHSQISYAVFCLKKKKIRSHEGRMSYTVMR